EALHRLLPRHALLPSVAAASTRAEGVSRRVQRFGTGAGSTLLIFAHVLAGVQLPLFRARKECITLM
ncbi:MAG: hypothetical protein M3Z24_11840, partial [Chloroflexota bacterium]|nr:hypothetical protein [Chloroflexota bacterium]